MGDSCYVAIRGVYSDQSKGSKVSLGSRGILARYSQGIGLSSQWGFSRVFICGLKGFLRLQNQWLGRLMAKLVGRLESIVWF